jgi:hypothetical protein
VSRVLLVPSLFFLLGSAWAADPVHFADPHLKAVVEEALWISDPTPEDMLGLTSLLADRKEITNLSGLEYATNLEELWIRWNRISDLSPLSGLTSLRYLDAHANLLISNISPLSGLTNLEMLIIRDNRISDISALSGLTNLKHLYLEWNNISDLSSLSSLTSLQGLSLQYNDIRDVSPLCSLTNLGYVDLRGNPLNADACATYIPKIVANNPGITIEYNSCAPRRVVFSSTRGGSIEDPGEGEFFYDNGDVIFVKAKADPGYVFVSFSGTFAGSENPMFISIEQDLEIRAVFARVQDPNDVDETPDDPVGPHVIHVDDDSPFDPGPGDPRISDPLESGASNHPFDQIQEAIDDAEDGSTIFVHTGTYRETINLLGAQVEVTGFDPANPKATAWPVIDGNGVGPVVSFTRGEGPACTLRGLVITGGRDRLAGAIRCASSSPTLANCLIAGNRASDASGSVIYCTDSSATFTNCTIADNQAGVFGAAVRLDDSPATITNSILWGNVPRQILFYGVGREPVIRYSTISGGWQGVGNLEADPLFAVEDQWVNRNNPKITVKPDNPDAVWIMGDYHLQSQRGRWDPKVGTWVQDNVASPCIDAGDPDVSYGDEIFPNGLTINMGMYGGTVHASKSVIPK